MILQTSLQKHTRNRRYIDTSSCISAKIRVYPTKHRKFLQTSRALKFGLLQHKNWLKQRTF